MTATRVGAVILAADPLMNACIQGRAARAMRNFAPLSQDLADLAIAVPQIKRTQPHCRIVFLTRYTEAALVGLLDRHRIPYDYTVAGATFSKATLLMLIAELDKTNESKGAYLVTGPVAVQTEAMGALKLSFVSVDAAVHAAAKTAGGRDANILHSYAELPGWIARYERPST